MNNSRKVLQFTNVFCQYLRANVSILNSLRLISEMKNINSGVRKAALELYVKLEEGSLFSNAIKNCQHISFPESYAAFVEIAQETGNVCGTMEYLEETENDRFENKNEFITISVYPTFVTVVSFVLSILLYKYSSVFTVNSVPDKFVFVKSGLFLLTSAAVCFCFLKKVFSEGSLLNLINALAFLTSCGTDIKTALEISMTVAQGKRSLEKKVILALDAIERGKSVSDAVSFLSSKDKYIFEIENTCGNISRSFKNLLRMEKQRRKVKLKRIKNLCEPVMILIVSIYILIIARELIMPVLFDYTNII